MMKEFCIETEVGEESPSRFPSSSSTFSLLLGESPRLLSGEAPSFRVPLLTGDDAVFIDLVGDAASISAPELGSCYSCELI